jgi:hypothetical protein
VSALADSCCFAGWLQAVAAITAKKQNPLIIFIYN